MKTTQTDNSTGQGVILIVDDLPTNLELLFEFLSSSGFRILIAEDGQSAIERARYALPDLILLDILMPGMDGFETCRRLKAEETTADIPIIFMTALTETVDKIKGFNLGAVDYITKPFQQEELLARVKTHLKIQKLTRQIQEQTERERLAQAEREIAQNRASVILESITDAFFALDHEWRFTYLNQHAEALLQCRREDVLGKAIWDDFPDGINLPFYQEYQKAAAEQVSVEFEAFYPPLGEWFEVRAYPSQEGVSVYFRNISQRKQMEADREQAQAEIQRQNQRSQLFAEISLRIRQSLKLEEILQTTVTEVQQFLQSDRVLLFQLFPDGSGTVVQEAVTADYLATIGRDFLDPCFQEGYLEQYRQGRIGAIANIEQIDTQPCYIEFLQQLCVKANLVVPIFIQTELWGLLIAHQCSQPRQWTTDETSFLQQLANQIGIALSQAQLLEQEIHQRQALARSQEELRIMSAALESAVEGISQLDCEGRYVKVNPAYARMVGYEPEELIGMKWQEVLYPEDHEIVMAAYEQLQTTNKVEVEARGLRKDGSVFDKQVVMVKAYDQQQQCIGHYCFMKDISDRREVERLKDEFVSVVSHELRTPLTSISGALDLLANGVLQSQPEDAQRMLNIAASSTDRLVRLINDILDIERIESGKVAITPQACNASDLMNQSAEVLQEMAHQAGVTLQIAPLAVSVWADPDRIIQVLTNLLSNAIKFSAPGSSIRLSAALIDQGEPVAKRDGKPVVSPFSPSASLFSSSPYVLFKVSDQGRGIPPDKLETIFGRFQQVDASDSRQKGGTGLGLAICRTILQHHGGRIWAESSPGEGSTFFFTLPVFDPSQLQSIPAEILPFSDHPPSHPSYSSAATLSDGGSSESTVETSIEPRSHSNSTPHTPLILVCDNDFSVRTIVQAMLERQRYRVLTAATGEEAINLARQHLPDVIFLNLMMPGMDGWETLAQLKQQPATKNIPVIILSGLSPDARKSPPSDISDWIVKPPNQQLLRRALERALAKSHQVIRVLVVEDDLNLAQVLLTVFSRHGIQAFHAATGRAAIQLSQQIVPDLLVLDLGLPEQNGFAVVDWLRQHNHLCQVPVVVYTAHDLNGDDRDRLKLGQTLFLTKGRVTPQEFERQVVDLLNRITVDRGGDNNHGNEASSDH
jgi:PAS domain S-box-containing protein